MIHSSGAFIADAASPAWQCLACGILTAAAWNTFHQSWLLHFFCQALSCMQNVSHCLLLRCANLVTSARCKNGRAGLRLREPGDVISMVLLQGFCMLLALYWINSGQQAAYCSKASVF